MSHTGAEYPICDLALARRLEMAEGWGGAAFAEAHARLDPAVGAERIEVAGAVATFDGVGSPITQSFGLGLSSPVAAQEMSLLEDFFHSRGAAADHEVSPLAGDELFGQLFDRGYRPIELTSAMFLPLRKGPEAVRESAISTRLVGPREAEAWSRVCAEGWREDAPELFDFLLEIGRINSERTDAHCFLAELEGEPIAAGLLTVREGVALLAGASTIAQWRRRGAQRALLDARLLFAVRQGCDLAMMCAKPGSASQRNAEREGFRIAYTRVKWHLPAE